MSLRVVLPLVALLSGWVAGTALPASPPDRHVVVISIDGFPAYLLNDPKVPLTAIRGLARQGAAAEGMHVSNPSVTWPNHTTLVTGVRPEKHGVLFNGVLLRAGPGEPVSVDSRRDKAELVRVPTLYDVLHEAGFRTAEINWPCTRNCPGLDDGFPDVPGNVSNATPRLRRELVAEGILANDSDAALSGLSSAGRDDVWTRAACHLIRRRRPHLLLLHLLNVDSTHHAAGPRSPAGYTAVAYADACVARVLAALDESGLRERTTVFVVADHGFSVAEKALKPNALLREAGLLKLNGSGKIIEARAQVVPEGGTGMIYLTDPAHREADAARVRELLEGREGVREILTPDQFAANGLPHPREYPQMADLILVARDGYAVSGAADGDSFVVPQASGGVALGNHGYIATDEKMNALFVAAGIGIKPGVKLRLIDNVDLAPTIAQLFELSLPSADGRVLRDILTE
ncbi:MAG TPA: alkaline phosphatase family protein [Pirellulales bacterium]|nr:alkaline phosphatase family protein [Pirellulales bacterium]